MRRLLPFIACLMLVLTGWSGVAHAGEVAGGAAAGLELAAHAPGDGDEVPADDDSALPHHHATCHGHDLGTSLPLHHGPALAPRASLRPAMAHATLEGLTLPAPSRPPRA